MTEPEETAARVEERQQQIESEVGRATIEQVREHLESRLARAAAVLTTASAWIDHYLLIDFGFTAGVPFQPNSVQFYSASGFLCSKLVDNASMQTLGPILACKYVHVTWDVSTLEAVHVYGYQSKP